MNDYLKRTLTPIHWRFILIVMTVTAIISIILGFFVAKLTIKPQIITEIHTITEKEPYFIYKYETVTPDAPVEEASPEREYIDCPLDYELQDYITDLCEPYGLDSKWIIALIEVESVYDANALSKTNDYGLMQINSCNHKWLIEKYGNLDFFNPYDNVLCGIEILGEYYNQYHDIDKALMCYNMGDVNAKRNWNNGRYSTDYTTKVRKAYESL